MRTTRGAGSGASPECASNSVSKAAHTEADGVAVPLSDGCHPAPSAATSDGWTPELRRLEREYDEARHAAHAAHDGFEEGLIRAAQEAWERFSTAVQNGR